MSPGHILLHPPLNGRSVYQFTCPACLAPVEKPADLKAAALLLAAGVDLATEDSLLGDLHSTDSQDGALVPDRKDPPPGPAFTLDDLIAFHFLLMDNTYIQEFFEGQPR
jgi:hypothetical protein